jgi:hypothetical protein
MGGANQSDLLAVMLEMMQHLAVEFIVHRIYVTFLGLRLSQYIRSADDVKHRLPAHRVAR